MTGLAINFQSENMFISFAIILAITIGGCFLTYLYEKENSLLMRICAGNIIGSTVFSLIAFLLACLVGFSATTILVSVILMMLSLLLLTQNKFRQRFAEDLQNSKVQTENINLSKIFSFFYYIFIFIVLCFFFDRAMFEAKDGIFTGGSNNLGDLPFHLGAIFSFTEGNNFPPENPSFARAKFTYPFIVDFIAACFVKLGAKVEDAMFVQNITLGFSLVVLLERFTVNLVNSRLAGKIAPLLLLFCGGFGFALFFRDYWQDGRSIFEFIWHLEKDYTIRSETLRWGNSLIVLFLTQRGFLLGLPIVLIILTFLWKLFNAEKDEDSLSFILHPSSLVFCGFLAGMLPLIHTHSLFVLFIVSAFLFFFSLNKWKEWLVFGGSVALVAIPEMIWFLTGSASNLSKFIEWHFGWHKGNDNFFLFWLINLGFFIPLLVTGLVLTQRGKYTEGSEQSQITNRKSQIIFYLPFAFIFLLSNTFKLAPWEWDNIKVLFYWFVASVPFVAWFLAYLWKKQIFYKFSAIGFFIVLTLSGVIDVWRVMSKQINYQVFNANSVKIAEEIKQKTPPNALFLNAPTYNSAIVLSGRLSFMRYIGHLSSYGINYELRQSELDRIYEGSALAEKLLADNKIEYVLISPEERSYMKNYKLILNEEFFQKYPKIAEIGEFAVYKVK